MKIYAYYQSLLVILILGLFQSNARAGVVKIAQVDGVISPATLRYIQRGIDVAEATNADALVIQLDTPGGLMDSMRDIVKSILGSKVPIIVYIAPSGSRAGSAGVFITLAAHIAAMAPGTNIGAAHPVNIGMHQTSDSSSVMEGKIVNDAAAFIRSIADSRHRNVDWAEKAVRQSVSITETEALKIHVIDYIAPDLDSLFIKLDGKEVELSASKRVLTLKGDKVEIIAKTWRDRLLEVISDPNIAYILMLLGIYGMFFELYNPGAIVPGVIGGICLILAFFAFQSLPINVAGILLIILSLILFLLEIKITSYGILAIGGTISLILGSVMLIETDIPELRISWSVIIPAAVATVSFFFFAIVLSAKAQRRQPTTGTEGMIGEIGVITKDLCPIGYIKVHGEIWQAKILRGSLTVGTRVQVRKVESMILIVEEYNEP
jgi:membrane-bound serine protease (ClpP class)